MFANTVQLKLVICIQHFDSEYPWVVGNPQQQALEAIPMAP